MIEQVVTYTDFNGYEKAEYRYFEMGERGTNMTDFEKFWEIVNEEYDHRDMLTFDEIREIMRRVKEN